MTITYFGAHDSSSSGGTDVVTIPVGYASQDIAIYVTVLGATTATITPPSGFSSPVYTDASASSRVGVCFKVLDGTEGTTLSFTRSSGIGARKFAIWRPTGTVSVADGPSGQRNGTNLTTSLAPSRTAPGAGKLITWHLTSGAEPITAPSGMTIRGSVVAPGGAAWRMVVADEDIAASGATGVRNATSSTTGNGFGLSIFLTETGGGGDTTPPVITGPTGAAGAASISINVAEGVTACGTWTANETVTWSISGTDASLFSIGSSTGVLTFNTAPDFEAPADAGANNVYNLTVTATDAATNASSQTVAITVTNVAETMTIALKLADGTTAAASITGIEYAILNASTLGAATSILDTGTGESTDASGNLVLDITGLGLSPGNVRYVIAGKSNGTVGANFDGWQGPAAAA